MIQRMIIVVLALMFVGACNALEHDPTPLEGFNENEVNLNPFLSVGRYDGVYSGSMALESKEEGCPCEEPAADATFTLDVIHVAQLISIQFDDAEECSGKLYEEKVTVVKKDVNDTKMFHLRFLDDGTIEGACDCHAGVGDTMQFEPCARYRLSLSKNK